MLSKETIAMIEARQRLDRQIAERIAHETKGRYGFCAHPNAQLWADPEFQHDVAELEDLVGPVYKKYVTDDDCVGYEFTLGTAPCIIIMPATTTDSRGEACDVGTDQEA